MTKSNDKATEAIKGWVDAYNSLIDTFNTLTKYKAVDQGAEGQDKDNGALVGDSVVRMIQTGIRAQFANSGSEGAFKTLNEIGIKQDGKTGKMTIDDTKLKKRWTKTPLRYVNCWLAMVKKPVLLPRLQLKLKATWLMTVLLTARRTALMPR